MSDPREDDLPDRLPEQEQHPPGTTDRMQPEPDHGEDSYVGSGRLTGRRTLITGGDSGIGRAVAIAFAREGADVAIAHLAEEAADARETARIIEDAGRRAVTLAADLTETEAPAKLVADTVSALGGLDVLVINAAHQYEREGIEQLPVDGVERVVRTNFIAPLLLAKAAVPHLGAGASIITTTSIQAFDPSPGLIDYAMTKAALVAFTKALALELGPRGIRVNAVAPGPIWTPLIPATGWPDHIPDFGENTPIGRAGQPAELAGAYVYLASDAATYTSAAILPVTGGRPL